MQIHFITKRILNHFLLASFFISINTAAFPAKADNPKPVKIGAIFCLTGEIASGCNAIREGMDIALEQINSNGGINGRPLEIDLQDSKFTPRESHSLAVRFAQDPEILGVLITGIVETKAAASVLERAHLSNITLWDSAPAIEALGDYTFGIGPWLPSTYETSADFSFNKLGKRKAVVISTMAEWSLAVGSGFKESFEKLGGKVLAIDSVAPDVLDFRSILVRMLKHKPDIVYAPIGGHLVPFFRQVRELGFSGPIVTSDNVTVEIIAQAPNVFVNTYQSMVADPTTKESQKLEELYKKKYSKPAPMLVFHAWGYDGVYLMAAALRNSNMTRESVRAELLKISTFPGANGTITIDSEGSWRMPVKMFAIKGLGFELR